MSTQYKPKPLSYFFLRLLDFLTENYPHLANDFDIIADRDELANIVFHLQRRVGATYDDAMALADEVLFAGLHFSLHNTIMEVLETEYSNIVPEEVVRDVAIALYSEIEPLLEKYNITPEFAESEEYKLLYNEITGKVLDIFDHYGI